jgi:tetratricopeptide (TPR) repeat protein
VQTGAFLIKSMKKLILLLSILYGQLVAQPPSASEFASRSAREWRRLAKNESNLNQKWYYINNSVLAAGADYHEEDHLVRAQTTLELNRLDSAYHYYRYIVDRNGTDAAINHAFGVLCMRLKKWTEARDFLDRAANDRPRNPQYRIDRGYLLNLPEFREYDKAILDFNKALEKEKDSDWQAVMYQVYHGRGVAFAGKGEAEKAFSDLKMSLKGSRDSTTNAQTYCFIGEILYKLKKYSAAADSFARAITIDPTLHKAFDGRGRSRLELKLFDAALGDFNNAIETKPMKSYHYHRSLVYTAQQNYRRALDDLHQAIGQRAESANYLFQRGYVRYQLKEDSNAIKDFTQAIGLQLDTNKIALAYNYRGWCKMRIGTRRKQVLNNASTPDLSDFYAALSDFDKAMVQNPKEAMAYCGRGLVRYYILNASDEANHPLDKIEEAKKDFDKAIDLQPNLAKAYLGRGMLRANVNAQEALRDLDQAIHLTNRANIAADELDERTDAFIFRAALNAQLSHWEAAYNDYEFLKKEQPKNKFHFKNQGITCYHLKKYAEAIDNLNVFLVENQSVASAWLHLGYCMLELNQYSKSIEYAQKALDLEPTHSTVKAFLQKAETAFLNHRKTTEKATIFWNSQTHFNDGQTRSMKHFVDTSGHGSNNILIHVKISSISLVKNVSLKINDRLVEVSKTKMNDGTLEISTKYKIDSAYLNVALSVQNQAGDTLIEREIVVSYQVNACQKRKGRLALVIGNRKYSGFDTLKNSVQDAQDVADSLQRIGFQVIRLFDAPKNLMRSTFENFVDSLKSYEMGLFYYAGHGVQEDNTNYLIPIDMQRNQALRTRAYSTREMFQRLNDLPAAERPCQFVMILDACRDTFYKRGFYLNEPVPANTMISFAANAGQQASDNCSENDRNGLYTYHFLRYLQCQVPLSDLFPKVSRAVSLESNEKQTPILLINLSPIPYLCR